MFPLPKTVGGAKFTVENHKNVPKVCYAVLLTVLRVPVKSRGCAACADTFTGILFHRTNELSNIFSEYLLFYVKCTIIFLLLLLLLLYTQ